MKKAFHENHYSKLKTESQFINLFKYDKMLNLQWSRIYWSWMKCVQFYLFSLFVWLSMFVFVCLIIQIIQPPTEVSIRWNIALESTLFAWWLTHLFLTTSVTCLYVSHHFTFMSGPLPLVSSNLLSSGPSGTMYSTSVQRNACIFQSLFVW